MTAPYETDALEVLRQTHMTGPPIPLVACDMGRAMMVVRTLEEWVKNFPHAGEVPDAWARQWLAEHPYKPFIAWTPVVVAQRLIAEDDARQLLGVFLGLYPDCPEELQRRCDKLGGR